jgi:AsmA protein
MSTRSLGRRLLVALGVLVGLLVLLVVLLVALVNSGAVTKRAVDLVLPSASRALGRDVTLKDAGLKLFPNPRVTLAGVTVAGRPGEPALVEMEALDVEVGLWPLLRSLGRDVEVSAFTLVRPSVNLVKAKDGTWNFEGLGPKPEPGAPARPAPAPSPSAPAPASAGARVAVSLVRISGAAIRVVDRSQGGQDAGLALTQLDLEAKGVGPGLPLDARLDAALAAQQQNLHVQVAIAKLPSGVPQTPDEWPEVQGQVTLSALALDRIHALLPGDLGTIVRGGTATLDAKLTTVEKGYRVDGTGALKDVRLRGQSSAGHFRALAVWSPARPSAAKLDVTDLKLQGPGIDLGGNLSVETPPLRAWFVVTGPLLDVDAVMGVLPEEAGAKPAAKPAAGGTASGASSGSETASGGAGGGGVVPEATRRQIQAAAAHGTVAIEKVRAGRVELSNLKAKATLSKGTLVLDDLTAGAFGGKISGSGTKVSLAERVPTWKLAAKLDGLDVEKTIAAFSGRSPVLGKLNGDLDVTGAGTDWPKMRDGLAGLVALAIKDGELTTTDLGDQVLGGVSKGLAAIGKGGAAEKVGGAAGGKTSFRELAGDFQVKDGALVTQKPFTFASSAGDARLGGKIGLDGELGLDGTVTVPKKALAGIAPGVPLPEKLDVPIGLRGSLTSPSVQVRADQVASSLAKGQGKQLENEARKRAEQEGQKAAEGLLKQFKLK